MAVINLLLLVLISVAGFWTSSADAVQYTYNYNGRVTTGIPELSDQASGYEIKGIIKVNPHNDSCSATVQFQGFQFAEFNNKLGCDLRGDINLVFKPLPNSETKAMLETPFRSNFSAESDYAVEVGANETMWITNMKKAIISSLKIHVPFKNDFSDVPKLYNEMSAINSFNRMEETIHGKCSVNYDIHKLREDLAAVKNNELQERWTGAGQAINISKFPSNEGVWKLTRTVDFDNCEYRVRLQREPYNFGKTKIENQQGFLRGRSSTTDYTLRGCFETGFRIEEATVLGLVATSPYALKTELLQARTNQNFKLVDYSINGTQLTPPKDAKKIPTWSQEVKSPSNAPKNNTNPWITYTGLGDKFNRFQNFGVANFTNEDHSYIKKSIKEHIYEAAEILTGENQNTTSEAAHVANLLHFTTWHGQILSNISLIEIIDHFLAKNTTDADLLANSLVIDVVSSIGTNAAIQAVAETIKNNNISIPQMISFWTQITNNVAGPDSLPVLLDLLLKSDKFSESVLQLNAGVNYAHLVKTMCLNEGETTNYMEPLYGDNKCNVFEVYKKPTAQAIEILYTMGDEYKIHRLKVIEGLSAVAHADIIRLLLPIILANTNRTSKSIEERIASIYALDGFLISPSASERKIKDVQSAMRDILLNTGEQMEVRQAALVMGSTWGYEPQFWYQLAQLTWTEPSRRMAYYLTSFIEAIGDAKQWQYLDEYTRPASFAAKLAKPIAKSDKYSHVYLETIADLEKHISKAHFCELSKSRNNDNDFSLYNRKTIEAGGFSSLAFEGYATLNFKRYIKAFLKDITGDTGHHPSGPSQGILRAIMKTLNATVMDNIKYDNNMITLKMFDHMILYLPIDKRFWDSSLSITDDINKKIAANHVWTWGTFYNPNHIVDIQSTEIGVPLVFEISSPSVISNKMKVSSTDKDISNMFINKEANIKMEKVFKLATSTTAYLAVQAPWSDSFVKVSTRANREITLPFTTTLNYTHIKKDGKIQFNQWSLEKKSLFNSTYKCIRAENIPSTSIDPLLDLPRLRTPNQKLIYKGIPKEERTQFPYALTGLNTSMIWTSEMANPFSFWNLMSCLMDSKKNEMTPWFAYLFTSPTLKPWKFEIEHRPQDSETKVVKCALKMGVYGENATIADYRNPEMSDGKDSSSPVKTPTEFFKEETKGPELKYEDSLTERAKKLTAFYGGPVPSKGFKVNFIGKKEISYEMLCTWSCAPWHQKWKHTKSQVAFLRSSVSDELSPASVCFDMEDLEAEKSLDDFDKMTSPVACYHKESIRLNCSGIASITHQKSLDVSQEQREQVVNSCRNDETIVGRSFVKNNFIYDRVNCSVQWKTQDLIPNNEYPILSMIAEGLHLASSMIFFGRRPDKPVGDELNAVLTRDFTSGKWDVDISKGDLHEKIICNEMNEHLDQCFSDKTTKYPDYLSPVGIDSEKCIINAENINSTSINTFDGVSYIFSPTPCYTVMAMECDASLPSMLLVKRSNTSNGLDIKLVSKGDTFYIDIEGDNVKLNGKPINITGGQLVDENGIKLKVQVYKTGKSLYTIREAMDCFISIRDNKEITVTVKDGFNKVCGLCGNYDREEVLEFTGPSGCHHNFPDKNYTSAWTGLTSDACDANHLQEVRSHVSDYQKTCQKTKSIYESIPKYCQCDQELNLYPIVTDLKLNETCVSSQTVTYCVDDCPSKKFATKKVDFNCWSGDQVPEEVKKVAKLQVITGLVPFPIKLLEGSTKKSKDVQYSTCR